MHEALRCSGTSLDAKAEYLSSDKREQLLQTGSTLTSAKNCFRASSPPRKSCIASIVTCPGVTYATTGMSLKRSTVCASRQRALSTLQPLTSARGHNSNPAYACSSSQCHLTATSAPRCPHLQERLLLLPLGLVHQVQARVEHHLIEPRLGHVLLHDMRVRSELRPLMNTQIASVERSASS